MQKYLKYFILILILCSLSLPWSYNYLSSSLNSRALLKINTLEEQPLNNLELQLKSVDFIRIGIVSCGLDRFEETLTLIKSAIISGLRFNLESLEIILFSDDDLLFPFDQKLSALKSQIPNDLQFRYEIHPLIYPPGEDTKTWLYLFRPCATQRLFFPSALPHIDSLLYLDTDLLIFGDLRELYSSFDKMNGSQHTALAPEHERYSTGWYNRFAKHPFYPPLGVNSGVMLMNLSKLREFHWESKAIKYYKEYKKHLVFGDQDIINIIFHFYPESLLLFPCAFNYRPDHCIYGQNCPSSISKGIKLLHGNRRVFHEPSKVPQFQQIYSIFHKFKLSQNGFKAAFETGIIQPLKSLFSSQGNSSGCKDLSQFILNNLK